MSVDWHIREPLDHLRQSDTPITTGGTDPKNYFTSALDYLRALCSSANTDNSCFLDMYAAVKKNYRQWLTNMQNEIIIIPAERRMA